MNDYTRPADDFVAATRFQSLTPTTLAFVVGCVAFAGRYALTGAIENDHFITLARALQMLYGDWPVRDFEDPGTPLAYLISTAAAMLFGPSLFVNVLLCLLFFAITAALTYLLAVRATGTAAAGLVAAALTIVIAPRLYNTTKVIVPVVAIWLAWRYADAPRRRGVAALAIWTAISFLLRHDYLVYVALGNAVLLAVSHADAPRDAARRLAGYAALSLLLISPWLMYVQWYEGVGDYFTSGLGFVAAEGRRTAGGALPPMFFLLVAVPVAGVLSSFRSGPRLNRAQLASASVMLLSLDIVFLRDVLAARVPDVIAPTAVVAAAVAGHVFSTQTTKRMAMVGVVAVVLVAGAQIASKSSAIPTPVDVARRVVRITRRLRQVSPEIMPNPGVAPLVTYLTRCTGADARVLVAGFGPEIPVLAHRPFAARLPTWIPGYYEDAADVSRAVARLHQEPLGAAVLLDGTNVVAQSWPAMIQSIRDRGFDEYPVSSINPRLRVWLPHAAAAAPREPSTDLPCPAR